MSRIVSLVGLCVSLWFVSPANGQWVKTNGPYTKVRAFGGLVSSLAASGNYVFAGMPNYGVAISSDGGTTWSLSNSGLWDKYVQAVAFDGGSLYAATRSGLFVSRDTGRSWSELLIDSSFSMTAVFVSNHTSLVGSSFDGIGYSADNGGSWSKSVLPSGVEGGICFVRDGGRLYAGTTDYGIVTSTDNGATWALTAKQTGFVHSLAAQNGQIFASVNTGVIVSSDQGASWHPSGLDSLRIYCLAVQGNDMYASTQLGKVYRSTDNGSNWSAVNNGLTPSYVMALCAGGGNVYAGGDGLYRTTNSGSLWSQVLPLLTVSPSINKLSVAYGKIFAATDSGIYVTSDTGANWTVAPMDRTPSVHDLLFGGDSDYAATNRSVYLSRDHGLTWSPFTSSTLPMSALLRTGGKFYAAGSFVYYFDTGAWIPLKEGFLTGGVTNLINANGTLVATTKDYIYYSMNGGQVWLGYNYLDGPPSSTVNALAVMGKFVFAATSRNGVFVSTDTNLNWVNSGFGPTWGMAIIGLTDTNVTALLVSGTKIYAGTASHGVFVSNDTGAYWMPVGAKFPTGHSVLSLVELNGDLYAGTSDTGVWRYHIPAAPPPPDAVSEERSSNPDVSVYPTPSSSHFAFGFRIEEPTSATISIVNLLGEEVAQLFAGTLQAGSNVFRWDASTAAAGRYECIVRMNGRVEHLPIIVSR